MLRTVVFMLFCCVAGGISGAEPEMELWPEGMPEPKVTGDKAEDLKKPADGIARRTNISKPRIVIFAPEKPNGVAAIVIPGGGFGILADEHEGSDACRWLNQFGITGILLRHRCPTNMHPEPNRGPVQDAQRAMQLVRQNAQKFKLEPKRIGYFGYSAGGQVALVASTNEPLFPKESGIDVNHNPNFLILSYPWKIYDEKTKALRSDVHMDYGLPPTFIAQCADDTGSLAQGSTLLFLECLNRKIPAELHIYEKGGHGYGMKPRDKATGPSDWADRCADWLILRGLGNKPGK